MEENKTKKEITLEDLASMVQNGLLENREHMDKKFKEVNERFDKVDKRFDEVNSNIKAELNKKVDSFTHNDLVHRVEKLEEKTEKYDGLFPKTAKGLI